MKRLLTLLVAAVAAFTQAKQAPYGVATLPPATDIYPLLIRPDTARHGLSATVRGVAGLEGVQVFRDQGAGTLASREFLTMAGIYGHTPFLSPITNPPFHDVMGVTLVNGSVSLEWHVCEQELGCFPFGLFPIGPGDVDPAYVVHAAAASPMLNDTATGQIPDDIVVLTGRSQAVLMFDDGNASGYLVPQTVTLTGVQEAKSVSLMRAAGDAKLDLLVFDAVRSRAFLYVNESTSRNAVFTPMPVLLFPAGTTSIAAADVDGDGDDDVVAVAPDAANPATAPGAVKGFLNLGGTFTSAIDLATSPPAPTAVALGELLPADGRPDLMIAAASYAGNDLLGERTNAGPPFATAFPSLTGQYFAPAPFVAGSFATIVPGEYTAVVGPGGIFVYPQDASGSSSAADGVVVGLGPATTNPPRVRTHTGAGWVSTADFDAYGAPSFGVNVAAGDIDGSSTLHGADEVLTGPGPGAIYGPQVRAFDRDVATYLPKGKVNFYAYSTLKYGVNLASAGLDADVYDEMLTGAGPGVIFGPHVRGWSYDDVAVAPLTKVSFFAYPSVQNGVNVAAGGIDADAFQEIVTSPGPGKSFPAFVRAFNYDDVAVTAIAKVSFSAFATQYGGRAAAGDVEDDGFDEIVVAPGLDPLAPAEVRGFDYDGVVLTSIAGYTVTAFATRYGARVGTGDLTASVADELLVGAGPDPAADGTFNTYTWDGTALQLHSVQPGAPGTTHGVNPCGAHLGF